MTDKNKIVLYFFEEVLVIGSLEVILNFKNWKVIGKVFSFDLCAERE